MLASLLLAAASPALAGRGGGPHGGSHHSSSSHHASTGHRSSGTRHSGGSHAHVTRGPRPPRVHHFSSGPVQRDAHGKLKRSSAAKGAWRRSHPCPSTGRTTGACPGYEVDHRVPLACGGSDAPDNMQWLTKDENRKKGAAGCARR
ncbi:MAG: HNH endonuclease signature motif containing protein [Anaeromyxobacter sp.]